MNTFVAKLNSNGVPGSNSDFGPGGMISKSELRFSVGLDLHTKFEFHRAPEVASTCELMFIHP